MAEPPPCHPGPTSRGGRGYNVLGVPKPGDPDEAVYKLCYQCGFPCRTDRDQRGNSLDSPGLKMVQTQVSVHGGGTVTKTEMVVTAGCPFCGSLNYEGQRRDRVVPARHPRYRR